MPNDLPAAYQSSQKTLRGAKKSLTGYTTM